MSGRANGPAASARQTVIENILLIRIASEADEWINRIVWLPF
jgi:hypothetical protein